MSREWVPITFKIQAHIMNIQIFDFLLSTVCLLVSPYWRHTIPKTHKNCYTKLVCLCQYKVRGKLDLNTCKQSVKYTTLKALAIPLRVKCVCLSVDGTPTKNSFTYFYYYYSWSNSTEPEKFYNKNPMKDSCHKFDSFFFVRLTFHITDLPFIFQ